MVKATLWSKIRRALDAAARGTAVEKNLRFGYFKRMTSSEVDNKGSRRSRESIGGGERGDRVKAKARARAK
eukprot:3692291-Pleurochrysis_carterae.AAC.1